MNELISIVVPVYQSENTLDACIKSILEQQYCYIEVILVDDGSTDGSGKICDDYAKKDERVKVIHMQNKGVSSARNSGLRIAQGKYIQFVDADDTISSEMCKKMIDSIEFYGCEMVICGHNIIKNGVLCDTVGIDKYYDSVNSLANDFNKIYEMHYLNPPWNKIFIKGHIKEYFNEQFSLGEDIIFNIQYMKNIKSVVFISDHLYNYSTQSNGLTTIYNNKLVETIISKYDLLKDYMINTLKTSYNTSVQKMMEDDLNYSFRLLGIGFYGDKRTLDYEIKKAYELLNNKWYLLGGTNFEKNRLLLAIKNGDLKKVRRITIAKGISYSLFIKLRTRFLQFKLGK